MKKKKEIKNHRNMCIVFFIVFGIIGFKGIYYMYLFSIIMLIAAIIAQYSLKNY